VVVFKNIKYRVYADNVSLITARCYAERGYEIACRLSVCDDEAYDFHTGWNTSKIIARPNRVAALTDPMQQERSGATETPPKLVEYGWGQKKLIKASPILRQEVLKNIGQSLHIRSCSLLSGKFALKLLRITKQSATVTEILKDSSMPRTVNHHHHHYRPFIVRLLQNAYVSA